MYVCAYSSLMTTGICYMTIISLSLKKHNGFSHRRDKKPPIVVITVSKTVPTSLPAGYYPYRCVLCPGGGRVLCPPPQVCLGNCWLCRMEPESGLLVSRRRRRNKTSLEVVISPIGQACHRPTASKLQAVHNTRRE